MVRPVETTIQARVRNEDLEETNGEDGIASMMAIARDVDVKKARADAEGERGTNGLPDKETKERGNGGREDDGRS